MRQGNAADEGRVPAERAGTVVIGLGNPLLTDEGVGIRVVEALAARSLEFPGVAFVDGGSALMRSLHLMEGRDRAVFVDCARMDEPPGTWRRFTPEEAVSRKVRMRQSVHETDLMETIALARRLDQCPAEVTIVGIEPQRLAPGEDLSPTLAARMDEYVAAVTDVLANDA